MIQSEIKQGLRLHLKHDFQAYVNKFKQCIYEW